MFRIILLIVALTITGVIHLVFDVPLGLAALAVFVGWPLVGTLITLDDDLEGGWSNPDGSVVPPWLGLLFWGQIIGGLALALAGFAVDVGWRTSSAIQLWLAALAAALLSAALISKE